MCRCIGFFNISRREKDSKLFGSSKYLYTLSSRAGVNYTFFLLAYARAKRAVKLVNKGLSVSFLCLFFRVYH